MNQLPMEIRDRALKQADQITSKKYAVYITLALISFGLLLSAGAKGFLVDNELHAKYHALNSQSNLSARSALAYMQYRQQSKLIFLLVLISGIPFLFTLNRLHFWWHWRKQLEDTLNTGPDRSPESFWVMLSERMGLIVAECGIVQDGKHSFRRIQREVEVVPETCAEISLGRKLEARIYFDPDQLDVPVAIETQSTLMLVKPQIRSLPFAKLAQVLSNRHRQ